jgi:hypothetical protein
MTMFWSSENGRIFGFLGRQRLLTEVGRHTDFSWIRIQRPSVVGGTIDIADDLLDVDASRSACDPAVDENAISMDGYFDSHQGIRLLPHGGGDDRFGNGVGQPVGMSPGKKDEVRDSVPC